VGDTDGLHHGYYLDDPADGTACVASYYSRDAFELSVEGDTLFEAVRLLLEYSQRDYERYRDEGEEDYAAELERLAKLRVALLRHATADRPEMGDEYAERYAGLAARTIASSPPRARGWASSSRRTAIESCPWPTNACGHGCGSARGWRSSSLRRDRRLDDGFPGTALKLAKDLWSVGGEHQTQYAYDLMESAYPALGREALLHILRTHRANRDLPFVDILETEGRENEGEDED